MLRTKKLVSALVLSIGAVMSAPAVWSQAGTDVTDGDWPQYNGNLAAQRYSPLDQINAENVGSLQLAWRFSTANFGPSSEFNATFTPLEIDGVLYTTVGAHRDVAALDATTGQVLWLIVLERWRQKTHRGYHPGFLSGLIRCHYGIT